MWPAWGVTDKEFLTSAGFDALTSIRIISYGIGLFLPWTIFGIAVILPVNYTANNLASSGNLTATFTQMTMSNIPNGSQLMWVHFSFLVLFVLWACFLLVKYYEEHIATLHIITAAQIDPLSIKKKEGDKKGKDGGEGEVGGEDDDNDNDHVSFVSFDESALAPMQRVTSLTRKAKVTEDIDGVAVIADGEDATVLREDGARDDGDGGAAVPAAVTGTPAATTTITTPTKKEDTDVGVESSKDKSPVVPDEDGEGGDVNGWRLNPKGEQFYELWPVRRGAPYVDPTSHPAHAGRYCVVVIDEPPRKFEIKDNFKVFGTGLRLSRVESLRNVQINTDVHQNWYWLGGAVKSKALGASLPTGMDADEAVEGSDVVCDETGNEQAGSASKEQKKGAWARFKDAMPWSESQAIQKEEHRVQVVGARMRVAAATLSRLFGDDFDCLVPIYPTARMDVVLNKLYTCQSQLARAEVALQEAKKKGKVGEKKKLGKVEKLRAKEVELQTQADEMRQSILDGPPCDSFLAVFHTAKAAAMAVSLNVNPINWRGAHLVPGPDPQNTNWVALQRGWWSRVWRWPFALFGIIFLMLFPVSLITGAFSQLDNALCGAPSGAPGSATNSWFCSDSTGAKFVRNVVTGILPSILSSVYQSVFLPVLIYACALAESRYVSLSAMDLRCADLFFHWNWANFFFQNLLGGTLFNGVRSAVENPSDIITLLGEAVPAASNFFINYVLYRSLTMSFFRLFYPHACVFPEILKWLHILPKPKTAQDVAFSIPLRNTRYSRDIGIAMFAVFVCSIAYAVIAPFILPVALIYFCLLLFVWRYQQLYVYQSAYSYYGQVWIYAAHRIVACLSIMVLFTGCLFIVKSAFVQGGVSLIGLEIFIIAFDRYLVSRYDSVLKSIPIAVLEAAPRVNLDPELYVPPPLRRGALGWHLEWGKGWQGWGAPRYGL